MPKVSVIITSYNHEWYIKECINSVLNQTFRDFEIIILDDASTDNSWRIITDYSDPRIRAFQNESNTGIGNREKAIAEFASGEYIAILDSDDVWESQKLEKQVAFIDKHPEIGAVFTWAEMIDENGNNLPNSWFYPENKSRWEWLGLFFQGENHLNHSSVLVRKSCFLDVGYYRPGYIIAHDAEMWSRLLLTYPIYVIQENLTKHRRFSDRSNMSGERPDTRVALQFIFYKIIQNYRMIRDFDDLVKIFPSLEKYNRHKETDIDFALAMAALETGSSKYSHLFGLDILFELVSDSERLASLTRLYDFDLRKFRSLIANHDVFSINDISLYDEQLAHLSQAVVERDGKIELLNLNLVEHDGKIGKLNQNMAQREGKIEQLNQAVVDRDERIEHLTRAVVESDRKIEQLNQVVVQKEQAAQLMVTRLAEINNIETWKLALSLRRIYTWLVPPNSHRARILDQFVNAIVIPFERVRRKRSIKEDSMLISSSGLFDPVWYLAKYPDVANEKGDPLLHYLLHGGFEGRDPGPDFSSSWYLEKYADVKNSWMNPLVHYLKTGIGEGRTNQNSDLALIKSSGLFDENWYLARNPDVAESNADPLLHYLLHGGFEGRDPGPDFSSSWYTDMYVDVKNSGMNPLVHYLKTGREDKRLAKNPDLDLIRSSGLFDEDWYLTNYPEVANENLDPALHYLLQGGFEGRDPGPNFNSLWYLDLYPDIKTVGMNPLVHYLRYGKPEGRMLQKLEIQQGLAVFDSSKDTVLVVSHQASRTGAPILSLNIVQNLQKNFNVVSLLLEGGSIKDFFRDASVLVVGPMEGRTSALVAYAIKQVLEKYEIKFAIVNSLESRDALPILSKWFVPTISLIHEFSIYTRPKGALLEAARFSNQMIFSTPLTYENAVFDNPELINHPYQIIPQGYCVIPDIEDDPASQATEEARVLKELRPDGLTDDTFVVLGVGSVNIRKGVDLFIEVAARLVQSSNGRNFRFVWIGMGYQPEEDMSYSVYLADQIQRAQLQKHIIFLEETSSIEAAYKAANVLLLSSRLDPMPNVTIDAMMHALPMVCFEKTTGIAEVLIRNNLGDECVAPYLDTVKMADKVMAFARSKSLSQMVGKKLRKVALNEFDMGKYIAQLEQIGLGLGDLILQEKSDVLEITKSGLARLDFFLPQQQNLSPALLNITPEEAIRYYVRTWASGIALRKLFPGFHPGIYFEQNNLRDAKVDPLAAYLRAGQPAGPWQYEVISSEDSPQPVSHDLRIALHLHIDDPDLLPEILMRLNRNQIRPDLFVSVTTESIRYEVQGVILEGYSGMLIETLVAPIDGGDIRPFLTSFGSAFIDRYDIVGHLHSMKNSGTMNEKEDEKWYFFLMENLLGGICSMADIVIGRLVADPSIGMIFPDDPNVGRWGINKPLAEAIGQHLGLEALPEFLLFPGATMFWARVNALRPIIDLYRTSKNDLTDSIPDDRFTSNVLERLIPMVASKLGFRLVLTNVTGITR